ncbi:MAG: tol-pal system protein YbgF [Desulfobacterales bacterium]
MNKTYFVCAAFSLAGLLLFSTGCATNTDVHRLYDRLSELEDENREMESSFDSLKEDLGSDRAEGYDIRQQFAGQDAEVDNLRSEMRSISGEIEEAEYRTSKNLKSLRGDLEEIEEKLGDLSGRAESFDERISRLEKFMGMEKDEESESSGDSGSSQDADLEELDEEKLYSTAKKAYDEGDHETAVEGFELFLEKFADSDRADNARFWIGEVYFAEKWFEKAILEYEEVIKEYPDGNKVPGAYLKQGMAFEKLGETDNAKLVFQTLSEKYPDSNEAEIAGRQLAIMED